MPDTSVILCSHNPRPDYLRRVLDALDAQTLSKENWELLLIDNASKARLADSWGLSWHPRARHIREDELGLMSARLRGIRESCGDLLVFVDDDNVLESGLSANGPCRIGGTPPFGCHWCRSFGAGVRGAAPAGTCSAPRVI